MFEDIDNNRSGNNSRGRGEITKEIKKDLGELSAGHNGWVKKVKVISWNGGADKLDIREWNEETGKCKKGISLNNEEAHALYLILDHAYGGHSNSN